VPAISKTRPTPPARAATTQAAGTSAVCSTLSPTHARSRSCGRVTASPYSLQIHGGPARWSQGWTHLSGTRLSRCGTARAHCAPHHHGQQKASSPYLRRNEHRPLTAAGRRRHKGPAAGTASVAPPARDMESTTCLLIAREPEFLHPCSIHRISCPPCWWLNQEPILPEPLRRNILPTPFLLSHNPSRKTNICKNIGRT